MGERFTPALDRELKKRRIKKGIIASVTGALSEFSIITIYRNSMKKPPDHFARKYKVAVELMGNGFVADGKAHVHASLGAENGCTYCGHLVDGTVTYFADIGVIY